jgi:Holliday junction DNA helicase RuvB
VSEARKRLLGPDDSLPAASEPEAVARTVDPKAALEDEVYGASLRPRSFDEYVGQRTVVENLKIAIDAANRRAEVLDHVLLYGPPGLGKTTLAALIARDLRRSLRPTSGPTLEKPKDLVGILTSLEEGDVLFIDEIHRLGAVVEEFLYPAMEEFQIDFVVDRGAYAKTLRLPLKRFTLVGATTRQGALSPPLRERFGIVHHLDYYAPAELEEIVRRSAKKLGVPIDEDGAATIASRSRGTPRIANRLLRRVRDFAEVRAQGRITAEVADAALRREGVDELGLDKLDRAFLRVIAEHYRGGPVGINAIAATLTEDVETLEDVVEPYLLKIGFVQRTASGRRLGPPAQAHLGLPAAAPAGPRGGEAAGQPRLL